MFIQKVRFMIFRGSWAGLGFRTTTGRHAATLRYKPSRSISRNILSVPTAANYSFHASQRNCIRIHLILPRLISSFALPPDIIKFSIHIRFLTLADSRLRNSGALYPCRRIQLTRRKKMCIDLSVHMYQIISFFFFFCHYLSTNILVYFFMVKEERFVCWEYSDTWNTLGGKSSRGIPLGNYVLSKEFLAPFQVERIPSERSPLFTRRHSPCRLSAVSTRLKLVFGLVKPSFLLKSY